MNIHLRELTLTCKKSTEHIPFVDFTYFYGKMGAGKSSIARLVDYCLGGSIALTPVLQSEFVSASLQLEVNGNPLSLFRPRDSNNLLAKWTKGEQSYEAIVPARVADGEIVPDTGVEILSDLVFYLADIKPPKVRRSKIKEDSDLARLSIRDLLWYCYLDQDSMDSSFFHLDAEAERYRRLKSRDVLRFVIGFHQEKVAELETELEETRSRRLKYSEGAKALQEALDAAGVASDLDMQSRIEDSRRELAGLQTRIASIRGDLHDRINHAVDDLRQHARVVSGEIEALEDAIESVALILAEDQRHINELLNLSVKFRRATAARAVLNGVEFEACPRCAQTLPARIDIVCRLCGQDDTNPENQVDAIQATEQDVQARLRELRSTVVEHEAQRKNMARNLAERQQQKQQIDIQLNRASEQYDSAFLSQALTLEHQKAVYEQQIIQLERLSSLPKKVDELLEQADALSTEEQRIRRELKEVREAAEQDTSNLRRLQDLFLDCLLRARVPGITENDTVEIRPPHFLPEVYGPEQGDLVVTSFANLSSGGKKTLFKCCFALAIHRLSVEITALLPQLLIIDSPMKNISTNENREQFEGFHELLYSLAGNELKETQFILIDNEFFAPPAERQFDFTVRHLTLDNPKEPPLVSYIMES